MTWKCSNHSTLQQLLFHLYKHRKIITATLQVYPDVIAHNSKAMQVPTIKLRNKHISMMHTLDIQYYLLSTMLTLHNEKYQCQITLNTNNVKTKNISTTKRYGYPAPGNKNTYIQTSETSSVLGVLDRTPYTYHECCFMQ